MQKKLELKPKKFRPEKGLDRRIWSPLQGRAEGGGQFLPPPEGFWTVVFYLNKYY